MTNKNSLRHAATLARQRLKSGYWNNPAQAEFRTECAAAEDEFRAKVRYIIDHEADIQNPIRMLLDENEFENADLARRQKMLFETSDKYRRVRAEIEGR